MFKHYLDELVCSSRNILILQGPIGTFFTDLSRWLQSFNKIVYKINFNGGDEYFYPNSLPNTIPYTSSLNEFHSYLASFCQQHQIDTIICFGDNRKYHKIGKKVAKDFTLNFWVFEEGYFRPDYVTLEKSGVNAFSPLPKHAHFFLTQTEKLANPTPPKKLPRAFIPSAKLAMTYYIQANLKRTAYPKYQHHRVLNLKYYIKMWGKSGIRRVFYYLRDRSFAKQVQAGKFGEFFIVPLQVHDDSQVKVHCDYECVQEFLKEVLKSFAEHAPKHTNLLIKHHPMDRGFTNYQQTVDSYIQKYPTLTKRVYYVHDVPLPVFLRRGKGMVTLNSTSGISALLHNMPVITLGRANYDFEGLTYQGTLAEFWQSPVAPNAEVFAAYRKYHLLKTMINGSFYTEVKLDFPYNQ